MRRARKGPKALGRLRKSLKATKRSLWISLEGSVGCGACEKVPELWGDRNATKRSRWKALLDAARAKRSQSSGAAPEKSKRQ